MLGGGHRLVAGGPKKAAHGLLKTLWCALYEGDRGTFHASSGIDYEGNNRLCILISIGRP